MSPGDKAIERLITEATNALHMTADPRIAQAQRFLIGLRSADQARQMEQAKGLTASDIFRKRTHG